MWLWSQKLCVCVCGFLAEKCFLAQLFADYYNLYFTIICTGINTIIGLVQQSIFIGVQNEEHSKMMTLLRKKIYSVCFENSVEIDKTPLAIPLTAEFKTLSAPSLCTGCSSVRIVPAVHSVAFCSVLRMLPYSLSAPGHCPHLLAPPPHLHRNPVSDELLCGLAVSMRPLIQRDPRKRKPGQSSRRPHHLPPILHFLWILRTPPLTCTAPEDTQS